MKEKNQFGKGEIGGACDEKEVVPPS